MSRVALVLGALVALQWCLAGAALGQLVLESAEAEEGVMGVRGGYGGGPQDSRERRAASGSAGMGSSFIRFGRGGVSAAVSQPHTRSDVIIRYGRDGLNGRLNRLRQERMRRLARLALVCAARNHDDDDSDGGSSAEDRILREICKDAPLHPTVPDFV